MKILPLYFLIVHIIMSTSCSVRSSEIEGDVFCSSFCVCDMWYKLRRASCTSRHLYSIQTGVSNSVQALDISDNAISQLLNYDLKNTGLVNLRYLNLSDNSIKEIGSFAFYGLSQLAILDLSRNHLYYVLWDTFVDLRNLRILRLDGNRFGTRIPDLHSNYITELSLSECQISHVTTHAFAGLKQLRKLDLSNNLMIQIDFRELDPLRFLKDINLNNNPWSCGGSTKQLKSYLDDRSINYDPFCVPKSMKPPSVNTGIIKFEKMIDATNSNKNNNNNNNNNDGTLSNRKPEIKDKKKTAWDVDPPDPPSPPPQIILNQEVCKNDLQHESNNSVWGSTPKGFIGILTKISPIWILAVGFSLGIVTSMLGTYLWITGTCMCSFKLPKIPTRRERSRIILDNNSQRISLLEPDTLSNSTNICPGTPPPPYRDVILHSSSYPTAPSSVISI